MVVCKMVVLAQLVKRLSRSMLTCLDVETLQSTCFLRVSQNKPVAHTHCTDDELCEFPFFIDMHIYKCTVKRYEIHIFHINTLLKIFQIVRSSLLSMLFHGTKGKLLAWCRVLLNDTLESVYIFSNKNSFSKMHMYVTFDTH